MSQLGLHVGQLGLQGALLGLGGVLVDEPAEADPPASVPTTSHPDLNPRQRWVLDQLAAGEEVRQKTVIEHFRREVAPSTIKRDLEGLRDLGLIETDGRGCYEPLAPI